MNAPRDDAPDSVPHDAWLREALRHAPDADALPPSTLSETILRQARAATARAAPPQPPSFGQRLAAAWSWLGRPPVAAGFASVMVAGVVGLMWWDRPIEESLPPRDAAVPAAAPMAAPASMPSIAAVPAQTPAPATTPAPTTPPAPVAAEPTRAPAPSTRRAPALAQAPAREVAPPGAAGATAPPAPRPAEAPVVADATAPAAPSAAPPAAIQESRAAAAAADADARAERTERARSATTLSKAAPPAALAARRDFAAPAMSIGGLRSAIAAQPERWRWSRGGGERRAVQGPLDTWLGQLDGATASRWQAEAADTSASRDEAAPSLQLWLDGRLHSTLRLDAGGVVLEPAAASARQRATLPASTSEALRAALEQATR
jgi:hypothetical protein